jgi:hypothetical protein
MQQEPYRGLRNSGLGGIGRTTECRPSPRPSIPPRHVRSQKTVRYLQRLCGRTETILVVPRCGARGINDARHHVRPLKPRRVKPRQRGPLVHHETVWRYPLKSSAATTVSFYLVLVALFSGSVGAAISQGGGVQNPILFVTQVPLPADFATVTSTFANQIASPSAAPRGGDLWIRYPNGTLKNLTRAAGFGMQGSQGSGAIAVREPSVHWSGTKALFSMVIGAPDAQFQQADYFWQMYEVTGLGEAETPVITKAANQPAAFNNVAPIYGTDDRIIFASDRPRNGARHLYPQLDEYEEAPTVTGLWSLDPVSGDLRMLNHTPSGLFSPSIDSFGRLVFTRWDHLQRDQQADDDVLESRGNGTFDYADESESAARLDQRVEVFPEPRSARTDLLAGTNLEGNSINHFFPWEMNEDGTSEETVNHIGRHELHTFFDKSFNDDPGVEEFNAATSGRVNQNEVGNVLQMREDPTHHGMYFGTDAPEFETHGSG